MASSRLPGKVFRKVNGKPMIYWQIMRVMKSEVDEIVVVTTKEKSDDILFEYLQSIGVSAFRGSSDDVLSRFQGVLATHKPDKFLRLTADCPLVMPNLINEMLADYNKNPCDLISNTNPPTFPDGLDVEIVNSEALEKLIDLDLSLREKEHVTLGMYARPNYFRIRNYLSISDRSKMRWTVDYEEDFDFVSRVYKHFEGKELDIQLEDVIEAVETNRVLDNLRSHNYRNIALINEPVGE